MRVFSSILVFVLAAAAAIAQSNVRTVPNCVQTFNLTADGSSGNLDNRGTGCNSWAMVYEIWGGTGAGSVEFEASVSGPAGTNVGLSFASFPSAPVSGSNPSTATFASVWFLGGAPFTRVTVTGLNGTLRGTIFGWVTEASQSSGGGGGVTSNVDIVSSIPLDVNILGPSPLPVSGTVTAAQKCTTWARINFSGTANAQIIPASGALTPVICSLVVSSDTATTIGLSRGTGANCGTGTTVMTTFPSVLGLGLDPQSNQSTFGAAASAAVCINSTVSAAIGGLVFYRYE